METGPSRDRFIDLVRGASIVAVVLGHWLVADVRWTSGALEQPSALGEVPTMWPLTWVLVVIPLFFFVGGYANRRSWEGTRRRGESYATFVDRRIHRVLVPSGLYVVVITATGMLVDRAGGLGVRAMGGLFYQPLWFLGVYLVVVALTPVTLRAHLRFGLGVPVALAALVALGDLGRFVGGMQAAGYANVLLVWLLMHQLGYACQELTRPGWMATGGLAACAALVALGPYPATMVGVPGGPQGNMHPPTLAITALGVAQIGGALLARRHLDRWLARPRVWFAVVIVNLYVITIYLWHQAALALASRLVLPLAGEPPDPGTPGWWAGRVLWLLVPAAVLAGLVAVFGRAEQVHRPAPIRTGWLTAAGAGLSVAMIGLGFLALAGSSATEPGRAGQSLGPMTASPVLGVALLGGAWLVLAALRRGAREPSPAADPGPAAQPVHPRRGSGRDRAGHRDHAL